MNIWPPTNEKKAAFRTYLYFLSYFSFSGIILLIMQVLHDSRSHDRFAFCLVSVSGV